MGTRKMRVLSVLAVGLSLLCLAGCQEGSSRDKAIELTLNNPVEGALKSGTVVYYKFTVEAEKLYEFKVRESVPLRMTILDGEGKTVDFTEDKAYWGGMTFDPAGQYYLRLEAPKEYEVEYPAYGDKDTAAYELMFADMVPPEDLAADAFEELTRGAMVENRVLDFFKDKHYYKVNIPASVDNKVIRYAITASQPENAVPVWMQLYDDQFKPVDNDNLALTMSSSKAVKTYYLVVQMDSDYDYNVNEYTKTSYSLLFDLAPVIKVDPASKTVGKDAGSFSVTISNAGGGSIGEWYVYADNYWLYIDGASSGEDSGVLTVKYSANNDCYTRYGDIQVYSQYGGSAYISVTQDYDSAGCDSSSY